jgi:hypothetical protein
MRLNDPLKKCEVRIVQASPGAAGIMPIASGNEEWVLQE